MKKTVKIDERALKELKNFDLLIQKDFLGLIRKLENTGKLNMPEAKKVSSNVFEMRIQSSGAFRGFYAYVQINYIIVLHFFRKKSQKTPIWDFKLAKRRLKIYEN